MNKNRFYFILAGIAIATVCAYSPVFLNGFINFDDPLYITENSHIRDGLTIPGFLWAFSTTYAFNWHPLTWLSHMADISLFGLYPPGHHLTNLLLHVINSLVLFALLRRMTGSDGRSAAVALLFALHPLHVESVAWVAERKDVLSGFFWFTTLWAYCSYVRTPGTGSYLRVILLFALGLMSKSMMVTLPVILFLLDYWPLGRIGRSAPAGTARRLVLEKIPLLALSAAVGIVTLAIQKSVANPASLNRDSLAVNWVKAVTAYVAYLKKMVWPDHLAILYPFSPEKIGNMEVIAATLLLLVITQVVIAVGARRRYLTVGWLWYLVSLLPVSGVVSIGAHVIADRYTYVPLTGIFIALVWGGGDLLVSTRSTKVALPLLFVLCVALSILTWRQTRLWYNSVTLFTHTVDVTRDNWIAHNNLGTALLRQKKYPEALEQYDEAVRIKPDYVEGYLNIGTLCRAVGDEKEAIEAYTKVLGIAPDNADAYFNLGKASYSLGDVGRAREAQHKLERIHPEYARALEYVMSLHPAR